MAAAKIRFSKLNPKILTIIVSALTVLAIVALAVFFEMNAGNTLPLKKYSDRRFSIQVPKDYVSKVESGKDSPHEVLVSFNENDDKATQSQVSVFVEESSEATSKDEVEQGLSFMQTIFKGFLEIAVGSDKKLENSKTKNITFKGNPARVLTANIKEGSKSVGKVKMVVGISDSAAFAVSAVAYEDDADFTRSIDKIIDSLEIK